MTTKSWQNRRDLLSTIEREKSDTCSDYDWSILPRIQNAFIAGFNAGRLDTLQSEEVKGLVSALETLCNDWERYHAEASPEALQIPEVIERAEQHVDARAALTAFKQMTEGK